MKVIQYNSTNLYCPECFCILNQNLSEDRKRILVSHYDDNTCKLRYEVGIYNFETTELNLEDKV